jgi:hypothetical protein
VGFVFLSRWVFYLVDFVSNLVGIACYLSGYFYLVGIVSI